MHIAILYNGRTVTEWQRRAIELIKRDHRLSFLVYDRAGPAPRRYLKHGLYYGLNLTTVRNRLTRAVALPLPSGAEVKRFTPIEDGAWVALPDDVLEWLRDNRVDAAVKFGLNLLRIPENAPPILSYHHGDPRAFRGRPAGFYELLGGEPFMGQVVQLLSNEIDAGAVLAFAQTRVHAHSYRKTLLEAYAISPRLLPRALAALAARESVPLDPAGRNFRLPRNATVARLIAGSAWRFAQRLLYAALVEKRWNVSTVAHLPQHPLSDLARDIESRRSNWTTLERLPGYIFYADGFFHTSPSDILVEALNAKTGMGELVRSVDGTQRRISTPERTHISYPQSIEENGVTYIIPETVGWSRPAVFLIEDDELREVRRLDIDAESITDPTLFRHGERLYLFGNQTDGELQLWVADGLFSRFELHPASPICVGSRGTRMAGQILADGDTLIRFGQDCRRGYGDGIVCFRIDRLDPSEYRESLVSELSFEGVNGPHTLNRSGDTWLFDWYVERKSPLAGVRRLLSRL